MSTARPAATEFLGSLSPVPPVPPVVPSTKSITSPLALHLKPGTTPLAPSRTPAPLAIVGGGSLKISSPDRPLAPSRPASVNVLAAIDANAPKVPTKDVAFAPPPLPPSLPPLADATGKGPAVSVPPAAPSSRPNTAPKAFAPPAGGPPASYERAFRQWSSPNITTVDESAANNAAPVTFQVYTAQDITAGRAPMRSLPAIPREEKKASLAARIGMAALGAVIVLLTAAAVIAVSTDDPKPAPPRAAVTPVVPPPEVTTVAAPIPTAISIGDPVDDEALDEPAVATTPAPHVTASPPKPKPKSTSTSTSATPAPSSLKGVAPPPNPYGK